MKIKKTAIAALLCVTTSGPVWAAPSAPRPTSAQNTTAVDSVAQDQTNTLSHTIAPTINAIIQQTLQGGGGTLRTSLEGGGLLLGHRGMAASADSGWPIQLWLDGNGGRSNSSLATGGYSLDTVGSQLGAQVSVTPTLVLGLSGSWQDTNGTLGGGFNSKSTALGVSPYLGWQFQENWNFSVIAGETWGHSKLTSAALNYAGDYQTGQWSGQVGLNGSYTVDRFRLSPTISMLYSQQDNRSFRDSTGARVAGNRTVLARGAAGGSASLPMGAWEPYVRAGFEHDFSSQTPNGDSGGTIGAGTSVVVSDATWLSLDAGYNSIGRTGLSLWSVDARANFRF